MSQDMQAFKTILRQLDQKALMQHIQAIGEVASEKDIWTMCMALHSDGYIESAMYCVVDGQDLTGMTGMLANILFFQSRVATDIRRQTGTPDEVLKRMAFEKLEHLRQTSDSVTRTEKMPKPPDEPKPPEEPFKLPRR
jgi:hypothetical protein